MKRLLCLLLLLSLFTLSLLSCGEQASDYRQAKALLEQGELAKAYGLLLSLGDYKDAEELLEHFCFVPTEGSSTIFCDWGQTPLSDCEYVFTYNEKGLLTKYDRAGNTTVYVYDEEGHLLEERLTRSCDEQGCLSEAPDTGSTHTTLYTYDEHGNRISMVRVRTDEEWEIWYYEEYTYDEKGNLLTETHFSKDPNAADLPVELPFRQQLAYAYAYDEEGRVIRKERTCEDDKQVMEYRYDNAGLLLEERFTQNGGATVVTTYVYDEAGRILRSVSPEKEVTYTYDGHGNLTQKESLTASVGGYTSLSTDTYEYTYDERGNVIKRVEDLAGLKPCVYEFVYDEDGVLLEQIRTSQSADYNVETVIRERYDPDGNVIEKTVTSVGLITTVTTMTYKLAYLSPENGAFIQSIIDSIFP